MLLVASEEESVVKETTKLAISPRRVLRALYVLCRKILSAEEQHHNLGGENSEEHAQGVNGGVAYCGSFL